MILVVNSNKDKLTAGIRTKESIRSGKFKIASVIAAIIMMTLACITAEFAWVSRGMMFIIPESFVVLAAVFALAGLLLAVNSFSYKVVEDRVIYVILSATGLLSVIPISMVFNFSGNYLLVMVLAFVFSWIPLVMYLTEEFDN